MSDSVLDRIDHVVVLMMENRSFDHLLGYLSLQGRTDIDGLTGTETNTWNGETYPVFCLEEPGAAVSFPIPTALWPDPDHDHCPTWLQLLGVPPVGGTGTSDCQPPPNYTIDMGGFVQSYATSDAKERITKPGQVMGYYTGQSVPAYHALAQGFVVCNRWFSSNIGSTEPNRMFSLAGTALGVVDNSQVTALLKKDVEASKAREVVPERTVFDALTEHGVSWRYYYHDICMLWLFEDYLEDDEHVRHVHHLWRTLEERPGAEPLPAVTWIDPAFTQEITTKEPLATLFGNDDHPPTDIRFGQRLVKELYDRLRASRYWDRTLLIITYDEHGGFYDHVPPPDTGEAPPYQRYGVRVPAILVSPWLERGSVSNELFDHTSIIRSLLDRFCGGARLDGDTPNRSDRATSLGVVPALDTLRSDCPERLPDVEVPRAEELLERLDVDLVEASGGIAKDAVGGWQELLDHLMYRKQRTQTVADRLESAVTSVVHHVVDAIDDVIDDVKKTVGD